MLVKNIVLVHGAFADGTSWSKIIPLLEAEGYDVVAVQNPLTSLADDVAATKRIIALQDGPVLLVGHSWGGAVITQAGDDPKVAGLVYVAAYAPEVGQSANDASTPFGWTEGQKQIRLDSEKFATVTSEGMLEDIAQGLPMAERKLALAVQGQDQALMGYHLGKGSDASASNGRIGRKEDGRGDDNSADLPHGHTGRASKGRSGYRRGCKTGIDGII